jgi:hypothetical protein
MKRFILAVVLCSLVQLLPAQDTEKHYAAGVEYGSTGVYGNRRSERWIGSPQAETIAERRV